MLLKNFPQSCNDITWELFAPANTNPNFFKIDVDIIKRDSANQSKTTTALEKNEIDDIHVVDNISGGFDVICGTLRCLK